MPVLDARQRCLIRPPSVASVSIDWRVAYLKPFDPANTASSSNAGNRVLPNITALFVDGTSGISQSTLRQLARHADSPTAYIIGRNEARASPFLSELRQLSPKGRFHFIEADVSLVRNVDAACRQILQQEKQLNFLFMTPGGISLGGQNGMLLLLLELFGVFLPADEPSTQKPTSSLFLNHPESGPSPVVSVYGGGFDYSINTSDLDLKHNFSLLNAYKHSITMTSLSMDPPFLMWPFMWPFSVNLSESGQRHLFHLSSARYPAKQGIASQGVPLETGDVARGTNGEIGSVRIC
ncbi:hypothetical protein CDV55_105885 [Aspergillus turcosus]|nr:hypothetical protein CDV55_105885 [Aspergillus turcosus]